MTDAIYIVMPNGAEHGYQEPLIAFTTLEQARAWILLNPLFNYNYCEIFKVAVYPGLTPPELMKRSEK